MSFEKNYIGGEMEKEDLVKYYEDQKGDMIKLLESIPLCKNTDLERFMIFFEEQFKNGKLRKNKKYEQTKDVVLLLKEPKKKKSISRNKKEKMETEHVNETEPTRPRKNKPADIGKSVPKRAAKKPIGRPKE